MAPPVKWRLGDGRVEQAVESIDSKSRLGLPSSFRDGIGRELLGHLDIPGRIRLLPWNPYGETVERALAGTAPSDGSVANDFDRWAPVADIVGRFHQLRVGSDGRIGLSRAVRFHLEASVGDMVLVWRFPGWIEAWTRRYWARRLKAMPPEVAGLPWPDAD